MTEAARCTHEWQWLEAVHVTVDRAGNRTDYRNVECIRCGCRAWKHGRAPNTPPVVMFTNPTTGRS